MDLLNLEERDRRWTVVRNGMKKRRLDALVVWGSFGGGGNFSANHRYLSNARIEGYVLFPLNEEPSLITFSTHSRKPGVQWVPDTRVGAPFYSRAMAKRLRELRLDRGAIGLVGPSEYYAEMGFPYAAYSSLMKELPQAHFEEAAGIVTAARRIKSENEIKCFEIGCDAANLAFQTILDTAKVGVNDYEIRSRMLTTMLKAGCEESMVMLCSGKEITHAGQGSALQTTVKLLEPGDVVLTEFDAKYGGYKAQHNQAFSVGQPDKEWSELFSVAAEAFNSGFKALKPGLTAGELDGAFLDPIKKAGMTRENPAFHGLGISLEEPMGSFPMQPAYKPDTAMVMEPGMVLEFEPHVVSADGKRGIHLGCPVLITRTGCRLLNGTWQPEFKVIK